jgi:hypothetical protein
MFKRASRFDGFGFGGFGSGGFFGGPTFGGFGFGAEFMRFGRGAF